MTFEFTPSWQLDTITPVDQDNVTSAASLKVAAPYQERAPSHPTAGELAELVRELFTEGSLTWDQLQALSRVAELKPMLEPAMAGIPAVRRVSGTRQ